jgi:hypothetical protein
MSHKLSRRSRRRGSRRVPCGPKSASPLKKLLSLAKRHHIKLGKSRSRKAKVVRKLRSRGVSKKHLGCKRSHKKH